MSLQAALSLLRGRAYEALNNRPRAKARSAATTTRPPRVSFRRRRSFVGPWSAFLPSHLFIDVRSYQAAVLADPYCYEAFSALIEVRGGAVPGQGASLSCACGGRQRRRRLAETKPGRCLCRGMGGEERSAVAEQGQSQRARAQPTGRATGRRHLTTLWALRDARD